MSICMRTTIRLDDDLLKRAKSLAVDTGRTLTGLIEDVLREALVRHQRSKVERPEEVRLTTVKGRGLRPGISLDDTSHLLDLMDQR